MLERARLALRPRERSLQGTLLLVAAAGIVPLVAVGTSSFLRDLHRHQAEVLRANQEMARAAAAAFEAMQRDMERNLDVLEVALGEDASARATVALDRVARGYGAVLEALLLSLDGGIRARAGPWRIDVQASGSAWFARASAAHAAVVSDLFLVPLRREPVFVMARAVEGTTGQRAGMVALVVDPGRLPQLHRGLARLGKAAVTLIDATGRLAYRDPPVEVSWDARRPDPPPVVREALAGREASGWFRSPFDGRERIGAAVPVRGSGWVALASRPAGEVLAPLRGDLIVDAALSLAVAALALAAALVSSRGLRRRLAVIEARAGAVGRGQRKAVVRRLGVREIDALAEALDAMSERVREREVELEHAQALAEERSRLARQQAERLEKLRSEREDLLRMMSHDVRTPLSAVVMQAELLRRSAGDDRTRGRARSISLCARQVSDMIQDLLDMSLAEEGRLRIVQEVVELEPFLRDLLERLHGGLPVDRVRLRVRGRPPPVLADPNRLERVLVNLISNALKYSPHASEVEVELGAGEQDLALISVSDHGPGIAPAHLARIFERYYRVDATSGKEGIGLGLFIARLLAEAHGGRLEVKSELGRGSTFTVVLPAAPPAQGRDQAPIARHPPG